MSEFVEFVAFSSWKAFAVYFLFLRQIPEEKFQIQLSETLTLAGTVAEMEGLANFVSECMLGSKSDDREATMEFDVSLWSTVQADATKQELLDALEQAFVRLHHALEKSSEDQLGNHFAMWQPGGMYTPAFAVMRLAQDQAFQRGQLDCLLKEPTP